MFKKRFPAILMVLALVFSVFIYPPPILAAVEPRVDGVALTILHTNDVHGAFEKSDAAIGHDVIAGIYDAYKDAAQRPVLLLDAGDAVQGVYFVGQSRGEAAIDIMNAVGYDAMTVGNHEFDYGFPRLRELGAKAAFPFLLKDALSDGADNFAPYVVIERGGERVGVFGVTTPQTAAGSVGGIELADAGKSFGSVAELIDQARAAVAALRLDEKVDVVVCLSHLGVEDIGFGTSYDIRDNVEGIDVIIDGHSHTALADIEQAGGKAPITSTGTAAVAVGVVDFVKGDDGKFTVDAHSIFKADAEAFAPRPEVAAVIANWSETVETAGAEIVASIKEDIPLARSLLRTGESVAGNLVADAMRAASGADVALENGGGVRDTNPSLPAGDLTRKQLITVLPFGNVPQMAAVKGSVLKEALEHGIASYPTPMGGFPQVSGVTFTFNLLAPAGARILEIKVGGEPLDPGKTYTLATNDFTGPLGGDGYGMLREPFASQALPIKETGLATLDEVLIWYLSEHADDVKYETEGRVVAKKIFADLTAEQNAALAPLFDANIINGFEDGSFRPGTMVTRGQLAAMLTRALALPYPNDPAGFPDAAGRWYENAALACGAAGYISNYGDGAFRGGDVITYGELARVIERVTGARPDFGPAESNVSRLDAAKALIGLSPASDSLSQAA
ncbi:MAG: 5'-nucleotidase C-terminal domain-containing protein [Peptococcaceae bacterium]|jgi:2',3'-cyclic-nucleotide 2'-phosphodiesterase (5'-nucleotidase family)|nr:5'-nucleotidase C-terminal domain-containing protein [Peptococcaceae bacterium]